MGTTQQTIWHTHNAPDLSYPQDEQEKAIVQQQMVKSDDGVGFWSRNIAISPS